MRKMKLLFIGVIAAVLIFLFINRTEGWMYVKVDGELFVTNALSIDNAEAEKRIKSKLGVVESKFPRFIKPLSNNSSNGFPIGTELYRSNNLDSLIVKYNNEYYELSPLVDVWGNGIKVSIDKNGKITP